MFFKTIPGKSEEKERLLKQISEDRMPHAQIFLGKEGAGSLALALAFSSYVLCTNKKENDSCGECSACLKSHKYIHPDVHFSFPVIKSESKKREDTTSDDFLAPWRSAIGSNPYMSINQWLSLIKADKSQANINVKECTDIIHKLNMMSYESDYKILIMWLPEYLGKEGNRLLKLIEEPPLKTLIILVAQNQDKILSTILSRCQLLKVHGFDDEDIITYLSDTVKMDPKKSIQIANVSEGNLNHAIHLSENEDENFSELLIDWLRVCYNPNPLNLQENINKLSALSKDEQKSFFEYGIHFMKELIYQNITGKLAERLTIDEKEKATRMLKIIDAEKAEAISNVMGDAIDKITGNINIKILLTSDSLLIGDIMKGKEKLTLHSYYTL
ncbi:MAG: hypothetical protein IPM42_12760 [Saprospiraceae bacterium]|nr:hypothetical protein [Saprospiraceae bacterium]